MLKENLKQQTNTYVRKNTRRKRWHQVLMMISVVVVFCTTYALILPAITLEKNPTCGFEEHQHSDDCWETMETVLSCSVSTHVHDPSCLDEQGHVICGNAEYLVHSHDELCLSETGELLCTLPEAPLHEHTQECYLTQETAPVHVHDENCYATIPGELVCTLEEVQPHIHSDATGCYVYETTLICGLEQTDGHQHGPDCFDAEGILICTAEEFPAHYHNDDCYLQNTQLVCAETETEGHLHAGQTTKSAANYIAIEADPQDIDADSRCSHGILSACPNL